MLNKILVTTSTFAEFDSTPIRLLEQAGCKVTLNPYKRKLTKEESKKLLPGYVGLIAGLETLDDEILSVSDLKVISRCGSGMSNVDLNAAKKRGIMVCNTPEGPTNAVAELTLAMMLNLLRHTCQMNEDLHHGRWNKKMGWQLENKTVCIIGFGHIGRQLAQLLEPFRVKIIVVDPYLKENNLSIQKLSLSEALPLADIVTLHCSGEDLLITEKEISLMKKGVFLLNAARGGLVDEQAILKGLESEILHGVWIDAFTQEPYQGKLLGHPRVLLTPHVGSYTWECRIKMELQAVKNLIKLLK